jgi:KDO2-lipid IV(A) lauroyltransferase
MSQQHPYTPGEFQWSFLLPKYWGIWIAIVFLMLLAILPWAIQWRLAQAMGHLAWKYLKSRRKTTIRNLEVCFPEWSQQEVECQGRQVFVDMMLGVFETLNAWYSPQWFKGRSSIEGLENISAAQAQGQCYYSERIVLCWMLAAIFARNILSLMWSIDHKTIYWIC